MMVLIFMRIYLLRVLLWIRIRNAGWDPNFLIVPPPKKKIYLTNKMIDIISQIYSELEDSRSVLKGLKNKLFNSVFNKR